MRVPTAPRLDMNDLGCRAGKFFRANPIDSQIACGKVFAFCLIAVILLGMLSGTFYSLITGSSIVLSVLAGGLIAAQLASLISMFTVAVSELAKHQWSRRLHFEPVQPVAAAFRSADLRRQHRPPRLLT